MPGSRVAHRFHDAESGDARRLADDRDLARALDGAQRVEDRIEILHLRWGAAALSFCMNCSSRESGRPTDRSSSPPPARAVARRCLAEHFGSKRREDGRVRPPHRGNSFVNSSRGRTASTPRARAASSPGRSPGPYIRCSRRSLSAAGRSSSCSFARRSRQSPEARRHQSSKRTDCSVEAAARLVVRSCLAGREVRHRFAR